MSSKARRHDRIRHLLTSQAIGSQDQLHEMLERENIPATQTTLSRDLRELGAYKGPDGYRLPNHVNGSSARNGTYALDRALRDHLVAIHVGGNLVVLRTGPGHADPLALEIDRAALPEIMGTIAGDDTIFVAARNASEASKIRQRFSVAAGIESQ